MQNLLAALVTMLVVAPIYAADQTCLRHVEPAGDYSFCPPNNWAPQSSDKTRYKSFYGPTSGNLKPNINVFEEVANYSLKEYVALSRATTLRTAKDAGFARIEVVGQSDFVTDSREQVIRIVYFSEMKNTLITSVQYVTNGTRGRKLIMTCTILASEKEKIMPICDRAAKTYRTEKKGS